AQGGADFLQIRQKKAPAAETHDLVRSLQARLAERAAKARILINDRVDIALATDAAGVHLATKSLPIEAAVTLRARCTWVLRGAKARDEG
ncbi:thiamine phosphate synthase, partial [Ferroacidibacillus organovorans]|uniref:thiamine phosphate synthase n=1 Tax=Ferroacidibacillus organovorans TaxID=1765683 RepID=UPI0018D4BF88